MFRFSGRLLSFVNLFVAASFALPNGKGDLRIRGRFVDRAVRRNNLPTATRTGAPARRPLFNVDSEGIIVSHFLDNALAL